MKKYLPNFLSFLIGFAFFFISKKTIEIFTQTIDSKLLLSFLNFILIFILIILLRKFGKDIIDGLIIAASLSLGILSGYLYFSFLGV